jgi:hypothetical protein
VQLSRLATRPHIFEVLNVCVESSSKCWQALVLNTVLLACLLDDRGYSRVVVLTHTRVQVVRDLYKYRQL